MIEGSVNASNEPTIDISVLGHENRKTVPAIIDTGFTGFLTLPSDVIVELALEWLCREEAILGNGAVQLFDVFAGQVQWSGGPTLIEIIASETTPLVGMSLISGHKLEINAVQFGAVRLTRL